jgi:hypothetical protein
MQRTCSPRPLARPEPERAARLLEVLRPAEGALHRHSELLEHDGQAIWTTLSRRPRLAPDPNIYALTADTRTRMETPCTLHW